jgi:hypothetical protein
MSGASTGCMSILVKKNQMNYPDEILLTYIWTSKVEAIISSPSGDLISNILKGLYSADIDLQHCHFRRALCYF